MAGFFFGGDSLKYTKPPLTFESQADLLIQRGLVVQTRQDLVEKLRVVNYYRLSAYWIPFRQSDETLKPGTSLELVWNRYTFDRQLRLLVMDAVERVEVAFRTRLAELHANKHGAFGYLNRANFSTKSTLWAELKAHLKRFLRRILPCALANRKGLMDSHDEFVIRLRKIASESKEEFVRHYFSRYSSEADLPVWMAVEVMTLGNVLTMFQHLPREDKKTLASIFGVIAPVMDSWLLALNYVRNICAHHSRLWNRTLAIRPLIPNMKNGQEWHTPTAVYNDKIFGVLTLLMFLLKKVAPQSGWADRLMTLFTRYPDIPLEEMGFPANWKDCPIWKKEP